MRWGSGKYSPNIVGVIKSSRLKWVGHAVNVDKVRSALKILRRKPTGKRPLGSPRRRWEDNIRMDQDRSYWRALLNAALNLRVP